MKILNALCSPPPPQRVFSHTVTATTDVHLKIYSWLVQNQIPWEPGEHFDPDDLAGWERIQFSFRYDFHTLADWVQFGLAWG